MGSHGIKDRVAIVGMGCTPFGEHWDKGTDDLLIDGRPTRRSQSAGVTKDDVDAYWLGTAMSGNERHGRSPARCSCTTSRSRRVENFCATGVRGAAQRGVRGGVAARTTSRWRSASRR